MNARLQKQDLPSATARAQAAAWIARLHGPNRTPEVEAGLRRWLEEDPERAAAFELVTDTWEKSARLRRRPLEEIISWEQPGLRLSFTRVAAAAASIAAIAVLGTLFYLRNGAVTTEIGEQRILTLEDGSKVTLNTGTRIERRYDKQTRRIELVSGEALFEVAKDPTRPFIVDAGGREIRALGTSFIVRRDDHDLAVTLVEGKVAVDSETLVPGQRLTFKSKQTPKIDRPALEKVTAWQRGQVALDNIPLADAIAEMNRYSRTQLIIESPRAAQIRISGIFRSGDSENFAKAVAKSYGLDIQTEDRRIVLADASHPTSP